MYIIYLKFIRKKYKVFSVFVKLRGYIERGDISLESCENKLFVIWSWDLEYRLYL